MRNYSAEEKIQRAYEINKIRNVMGRHAYYHAYSRHDTEMELLWAHKTPGVSWGNNMGFQMERDVVWDFYAKPCVGEPSDLNMMFLHALTTSVIEIAEDGLTAQAMWYTPGYGTGGPDGVEPMGQWMYERYAIDFVKEDDEWKIWHFFVGTDFSYEAGGDYDKRGPGGPPPGDGKPQRGVLEVPGIFTSEFGWAAFPPVPKPYRTFSETVSYGPETFLKQGGK